MASSHSIHQCVRSSIAIFSVTLLLGMGCSTQPMKVKPVTYQEGFHQSSKLGTELAHQFESQLVFKRDPEVTVYLRQIAERLIQNSSDLKGTTVGVWLIKRSPHALRNYSLPGNRLYLSIEMLKLINYDSEIAALIALELGNLKNDSVLKNLGTQVGLYDPIEEKNYSLGGVLSGLNKAELGKVDFFGPAGALTFTEDQQISGVRNAISLMYGAGFDSRGMVSILSLMKKNPKATQDDLDAIDQLIEISRKEIAYFSPLRNPTLRSKKFILIQKRIRKL